MATAGKHTAHQILIKSAYLHRKGQGLKF